jgi:hypothetical protein
VVEGLPSWGIGGMPLKDALNAPCFDKKFPFEFDDRAFREAGLNIEKTECQCDIYGLTVREWLRWLSAQFPKPIRLVEKDGKLVFTPASNSKPAPRASEREADTK